MVAGGHVVSTDRLIDDLWDGEPPPKALAGLQVHISNLRRVLEPDRAPRAPARILVSDPPGYAVRLPRECVDLWRFEDLVTAGDTDPSRRYAQLGEALGLWDGTPFGPHADDGWARAEVARLADLRLTAVEGRAAAALDLGRYADALTVLTGLYEEHPDREELFRLTALAQYRLGRQADALQTLRRLRSYLADELGVDPSPPVVELESAILRHDSRLLGRRTGVPASAAPPAPAIRVPTTAETPTARRAELETIDRHADAVMRPRIVGQRCGIGGRHR